jgi:hypothetical protein
VLSAATNNYNSPMISNTSEAHVKSCSLVIARQQLLTVQLKTVTADSDLQITVSQVKVVLRPTVSRSVHPGVMHPSGTRDQFFSLLSLIIFRQLRVY